MPNEQNSPTLIFCVDQIHTDLVLGSVVPKAFNPLSNYNIKEIIVILCMVKVEGYVLSFNRSAADEALSGTTVLTFS